MDDLYISKYVDLLKKINASSDFEKILTNKYILLTNKNELKLGNYQLLPLINTHMQDLYIQDLTYNHKKKKILFMDIDDLNLPKFLLKIGSYDLIILSTCDNVISDNDFKLLKIILSNIGKKSSLYYEYNYDTDLNLINTMFKHFKNAIFHSNTFDIKKIGFIEFCECKNKQLLSKKGGSPPFIKDESPPFIKDESPPFIKDESPPFIKEKSTNIVYKQICKKIDGEIKCENNGEQKSCKLINGAMECKTTPLNNLIEFKQNSTNDDSNIFNYIVPSIEHLGVPSIEHLGVPSIEHLGVPLNSSYTINYNQTCKSNNGIMDCKSDGEKKDCLFNENIGEMVCKTSKLNSGFPLTIGGGKTEFIKFMYKIYDNKIEELNKRLKEIEYIRKNYDRVMSNIDPYVTTLINNGIEYCNKHNLKYNKIYDNFELLNHKKFVNKYFKKINNVNLNNVKISLDANYSITLPIAIEKIAKLLKKEMPSVKYIIDGNANIGSTGIYLSTFFKHVYSVEVVKSTFDILVHNIKEYNFEKKITPFHDSIIDFMKNCHHHCHNFNIDNYCLFLDPPWSGVFYKTETVIDLFFNNSDEKLSNYIVTNDKTDSSLNIIDFIKSIKSIIKYVCIKVPNNYNFAALYTTFYKITIYRLNGFYFVLLTI